MSKQIYKLQKKIADSSDSILSVEEQILSMIAAYKQQKDIRLSLCLISSQVQSLRKTLDDCRAQLDDIQTDSLSSTLQDSLCVSKQLLSQNLMILTSHEVLLQQFTEHRRQINSQLCVSQDMETKVQIQQFKQQLQTYQFAQSTTSEPSGSGRG